VHRKASAFWCTFSCKISKFCGLHPPTGPHCGRWPPLHFGRVGGGGAST